MKTVSLKISEDIFDEAERILAQINKPRNRYINEAIDHYNRLQKRRLLEETLRIESALVREDSMTAIRDFEAIDFIDETV